MVNKLKIKCTPVLPLVYDDALSYYETLCKFLKKLNEIIELYNNIRDDFTDIVDKKFDELKDYVDDENQKQDKEFNEKIQQVYADIEIKIKEIYEYVDYGDTILANWLREQLRELKDWVEDAVLGQIVIYDPTTGYDNELGVVISHIYDALRYWGITCYQFDMANNTAQYLDGVNFTVNEFDTKSLEILGKYYPHYIFNPVDGEYQTVQRVLYMWFQYHRDNAITVTEFDALSFDVSTLEYYEFTAYGFDETSKTILT